MTAVSYDAIGLCVLSFIPLKSTSRNFSIYSICGSTPAIFHRTSAWLGRRRWSIHRYVVCDRWRTVFLRCTRMTTVRIPTACSAPPVFSRTRHGRRRIGIRRRSNCTVPFSNSNPTARSSWKLFLRWKAIIENTTKTAIACSLCRSLRVKSAAPSLECNHHGISLRKSCAQELQIFMKNHLPFLYKAEKTASIIQHFYPPRQPG